MLRKEVDFVPISPKKAPAMKLGLGIPRVPSRQRENTAFEDSVYSEAPRSPGALDRTPRKTPSRLGPTKSAPHCLEEPKPDGFKRGHRRAQSSIDIRLPSMPVLPDPRTSGTRTMEEKKEFLGSMLGNVDALVEGVRKAGIWGLG